MSRKIVLALVMLSLISPVALADIGQFTHDQGIPVHVGHTTFTGYVERDGEVVDSYEMLGHGHDIWGGWDKFQYAYREWSGDVRVEGDFEWVQTGPNGWAKMGVMIRGSDADNAAHVSSAFRSDMNSYLQGRWIPGTGSNHNVGETSTKDYSRLAVQRKLYDSGYSLGEALYQREGVWNSMGVRLFYGLGEDVLAGAFVTSHENRHEAITKVYDVDFSSDVEIMGEIPYTVVPADAAIDQCSDIPGFVITVKKKNPDQGWNWVEADRLMRGEVEGDVLDWDLVFEPGYNPTVGRRIDPVVNLTQDNSDQGGFGGDLHFPGVDLLAEQGAFPDDGDNDDNFAAEVIACVYLTEGPHVFGSRSDDGTILEIGGVEVGRSGEWQGASGWFDYIFMAEAEGFYPLRALWLEGGGGASLELYERLPDGSRILLGAMDDQGAFIGSPVYAPEPATIALLGIGGLALLRRKRS